MSLFDTDSRTSVSFKDAPVGTGYDLTIDKNPEMVQSTDFETRAPAVWSDGNPKMSVVISVTNNDTGEQQSLWAAKPSGMFSALAAAEFAAGTEITAGGRLVVTFSGETPNKNPRLNARKDYTIAYTPGNGGVLCSVTEPAATPAAPAAEPAAKGTPAADIGTAQQLVGAGLDDATILATCPGITPSVLAALRNAA
jgi:hypothetical protein